MVEHSIGLNIAGIREHLAMSRDPICWETGRIERCDGTWHYICTEHLSRTEQLDRRWRMNGRCEGTT